MVFRDMEFYPPYLGDFSHRNSLCSSTILTRVLMIDAFETYNSHVGSELKLTYVKKLRSY